MGMFEPNNSVSEKYDVVVVQVFVSHSPEQIPLHVANMSAEPIQLYKGTQVGKFEVAVAVLDQGGVDASHSEDVSKGGWSVDSLAAALNLLEKGLTNDQC